MVFVSLIDAIVDTGGLAGTVFGIFLVAALGIAYVILKYVPKYIQVHFALLRVGAALQLVPAWLVFWFHKNRCVL
jgi:hypothetical protein